MKKLYTLTTTDDTEKENLYVKKINNNNLDFITYFNSFSLKKWKQYTTLQSVTLKLQLTGQWKIVWKVVDEEGEKKLLEEFNQEPLYEKTFAKNLEGTILGFEMTPLTENSRLQSGSWYGTFSKWNEKKIGIAICTFKREHYVRRTISVLKEFQKQHPWLSVLVVDNGSTLKEVEQDNFQIIHNPNYGGSGGFTRGMLEYIEQGKVDYVLLMDDDIVLDSTALERTYSLLCGLQDGYKDSFLAGAMLRMEEPTIQHENTAYWNKFVSKVLFQGLDLTRKMNLVENGALPYNKNAYGGWWYCCIPAQRIEKIGYPLPAFIKSDDMEYGIRNGKELICLNGIGVWHESFEKKLSPVMRFFSDRNTFILNHYANDCNAVTLLVSIFARIIKRIIHGEFSKLIVLEKALEEYQKGFIELTALPGDAYFSEMSISLKKSSLWEALFKMPRDIVNALLHYEKNQRKYYEFRENELKDSVFWKGYLGISEMKKEG